MTENSMVVVKVGGSVLQDEGVLLGVCQSIASLKRAGLRPLLVHGGGPAINAALTREGLTWEFREGQRVTSDAMMNVIERTLVGEVNPRVTRRLCSLGVMAVGLSGASLFSARPAKDLGRVGVIERVATTLIDRLDGYVPVIAPLALGNHGGALNVNADWAACCLAISLGVSRLIYLTDQDGILDARKKLLPSLDADEVVELIDDGVVKGGMLAKARTIHHALTQGVRRVHVANARLSDVLTDEIFVPGGRGTVCRPSKRLALARKEA